MRRPTSHCIGEDITTLSIISRVIPSQYEVHSCTAVTFVHCVSLILCVSVCVCLLVPLFFSLLMLSDDDSYTPAGPDYACK